MFSAHPTDAVKVRFVNPKRIGIFVIAYNALPLLAQTLDRIPPEIAEEAEEIFIFDDCSSDDTYLAALDYKQRKGLHKLAVYRNEKNLRYGGNQKRGYQYAFERGFDIVVMLHGDGQYAPEVLPQLLEPLRKDEADMVFGSRMAPGCHPLKGGMPLYKYVGNRILTFIQTRLTGLHLTEFHSGYRLYNCAALRQIPLTLNSNEWHFDTEILIQFKAKGLRIAERPIPTYYGTEICHVNGLIYAFNCVKEAVKYWLHKRGWIYVRKYDLAPKGYTFKPEPHSSHDVLMDLLADPPGMRVLDVGTSSGYLARRLSEKGHRVTGIEKDSTAASHARLHCCELLAGDIEQMDLDDYTGQFDRVLLADVIEHLVDPAATLRKVAACLRPNGQVVLCVPNVANLVIRVGLLFGRFTYRDKGILDSTHLRFFTWQSVRELLQETGLHVAEVHTTPLPLPQIFPSTMQHWYLRTTYSLLVRLARAWKTLFAYQFVLVARKVTYEGEPSVREQPASVSVVEK